MYKKARASSVFGEFFIVNTCEIFLTFISRLGGARAARLILASLGAFRTILRDEGLRGVLRGLLRSAVQVAVPSSAAGPQPAIF